MKRPSTFRKTESVQNRQRGSVTLEVAVLGPALLLLLGLVIVVASGLLDNLDGAVAVLTDRVTARGALADTVCDRLADAAYGGAFWALGAPAWVAIAWVALSWLAEYVRARGHVLLKLNVAADDLGGVLAVLPAMSSPTVMSLVSGDMRALETVVPKLGVNELIPALRAAGARDILELPISKIVE